MGTHSTVKFFNENGKNILSLYNQYDGYYEGIGAELVEFFGNKENYGNGFSDTALLYVCWKKKGKAYNTYLTTEHDMQEYNYEICWDNETRAPIFNVSIEVYGDSDKIKEIEYKFGYVYVLRWATFEEFKEFIEKHSQQDEE